MKKTIQFAEEYITGRGQNVHVIRLKDNAFFDRYDLEALAGRNLYAPTVYLTYKTSDSDKEEPTTTDCIALDDIPCLLWYTNSRAIFEMYFAYTDTFYPNLKMNKIKRMLLAIYLVVFGKD